MEQKTKQAYKCAKQMAWKMTGTVYKLPDNKLNAYRQKLTSALTFEDFDRFNIVLLNLSNYVDEPVDFAYDLFEDFEKNKGAGLYICECASQGTVRQTKRNLECEEEYHEKSVNIDNRGKYDI